MLPLRTGSKQLIREINQAIVLNAIRTHGALSRTDIARKVRLSLSSVSGITAEMLETGLLYERSTGHSTGGRRPILLAINPQAGYVAGIKLTESTAVTVLTDLDASIVARHDIAILDQSAGAIVEALAAAVQELRRGDLGGPILGVGVGMAGIMDRSRAVVRYATYFGWDMVPFGEMLGSRLDLPVVLDNDVNALTAAEQWFGAGRHVSNFLVISLGRGVGLGMVLDGRLYRGAGGGAGEFGHVNVAPDGPLCACGKRGCLEALVSDPAIVQRAAAALGRPLTIHEAIVGAQSGDPVLQSIFAASGRALGVAVANLVNVLNPELIILGGEGVQAGDIVMEPFRQALQAHCFTGLFGDLRVIIEPWGDEAWARGAACLLLGELFEPALREGDEARPSLTVRANPAV